MDCAVGTRCSCLVVLWLVIQKQSDGALERGGLGAREGRSVVGPQRAVYVQLPQEFQGTVSSNVMGIRIQ
jgi:hypothetical protein